MTDLTEFRALGSVQVIYTCVLTNQSHLIILEPPNDYIHIWFKIFEIEYKKKINTKIYKHTSEYVLSSAGTII